MSDTWTKTTIGEFAPFAYGKSLPERRRDADGAVAVYGSAGIVGVHTAALLTGPTIIIGRKGSIGLVHWSSGPCWPIDTTFYVEAAEHRDLRFTFYLLRSLGLTSMNSDSAIPGLNRDAAHRLLVQVPPLEEQAAIGDYLGRLDDRMEINIQMNRTLASLRDRLAGPLLAGELSPTEVVDRLVEA